MVFAAGLLLIAPGYTLPMIGLTAGLAVLAPGLLRWKMAKTG